MTAVRFEGHFELLRPLSDLATVFDMTGVAFTIERNAIRCREPGFGLDIDREAATRYRVSGTVDPACHDAVALLTRLGCAFDADGIVYRFTLYDGAGEPTHVFEPVD